MSLNSNTTGLEEILASVNALPEAGSGEPTLQEKTVSPTTAVQNVTPDAGYDGLSKVTVNAMPTATQATPSIAVDANGKITASATQTAGYVAAGTKSATKQLTTKGATTITPSTSAQTAVASGVYTTGAVTVAGDTNLVAGNIKSGVSIFGVAGSYEGGGAPSLQSKSVTYTANGTATITPDEGYDGLSSVDVTVNVSGGGGIETVTLKVQSDSIPVWNCYLFATGIDGVFEITNFGTYDVAKNSMIVLYGSAMSKQNLTELFSYSGSKVYKVIGNAQLFLS